MDVVTVREHADVSRWKLQDVSDWLTKQNLGDFAERFEEEEIDGETLLNLSERMIEQLLPTMKLQVKLLKLIEQLKGDIKGSLPGPSNVVCASITAASVGSTEVVRNVWPQRYTLPEFPSLLLRRLGEKSELFLQPQRNEARTKLVGALADDILSKTPTPSRSQLDDVMRALQAAYPFLADSTGRCDSLRHSLINKMKKERLLLTHLPEVQQNKENYGKGGGRKRKGEHQRSDCIQKCKRTMVPHQDALGGTNNIEDHLEIMAAECSKAAPDVKLLLKMMAQTSQTRRVAISGKTTTDVIQLYPALCVPEVLQQELDLMKGTSSISGVQAKMEQATDGLLQRIMKYHPSSEYIRQLKGFEETCPGIAKLQEAKSACCFLCLPLLFNEEQSSLFTVNSGPAQPQPTLVIRPKAGQNIFNSPSFEIHVDGIVLVKHIHHIAAAAACLLSSYYVMDIAFCRSAEKTLLFVDAKYFAYKSPKLPIKVLRMLNI